ncbi:MAG: hypothetical protein PSX37_10550 [bacterium]|nr:hypothetical protein [bacterium]
MDTDSRAKIRAALDTAQAQTYAAVDEVEGISPSLLGKALTDIEVDDAAEAADRALQSLREIQDALDTIATLLSSDRN